jgi:hypothetical protein
MKKVLFAAFVGICVISSMMAAPANKGKVSTDAQINQFMNDTVPMKKKDTTRYPKPKDTTLMPQKINQGLK